MISWLTTNIVDNGEITFSKCHNCLEITILNHNYNPTRIARSVCHVELQFTTNDCVIRTITILRRKIDEGDRVNPKAPTVRVLDNRPASKPKYPTRPHRR